MLMCINGKHPQTQVHKSPVCYVNGCRDVPIKAHGLRLEIVHWKCLQCEKEHLAFYDLDLVLEKDEWSEKLLIRYLKDSCFRAHCVKHVRFQRYAEALRHDAQAITAESALLNLYQMKRMKDIPDYMTFYMFRNKIPSAASREKMMELIKSNGDSLLYNDPYRIPGYSGFTGRGIPSADDDRYGKKRYPLKNHFFALNHEQLDHFIDGFVHEEMYEAAQLLLLRKQQLPASWPDYSRLSIANSTRPNEKISMLHEEFPFPDGNEGDTAGKRGLAPAERPVAVLPSPHFQKYPYPVKQIFFHRDVDLNTGNFSSNEDKYRVAGFAGYEIFKLQIREARKAITYGHSHYLIRNSKDHGENCLVILLLENGNTVVCVNYYLNPNTVHESREIVNNRRNHDVETFELAIRHLLEKLLPVHFKVELREGIRDNWW